VTGGFRTLHLDPSLLADFDVSSSLSQLSHLPPYPTFSPFYRPPRRHSLLCLFVTKEVPSIPSSVSLSFQLA